MARLQQIPTNTTPSALSLELTQALPVDLRTVVTVESDLINDDNWKGRSLKDGKLKLDDEICTAYTGIPVFVMDTKTLYVLVTTSNSLEDIKEAYKKFYGKSYKYGNTLISSIKYDSLSNKDGYVELTENTIGWKAVGSGGNAEGAALSTIKSLLFSNPNASDSALKLKTSLYDAGNGITTITVTQKPGNTTTLEFLNADVTGNPAVTPAANTYYVLKETVTVGSKEYAANSTFVYANSQYILITDNSIGTVVSDITRLKENLAWKLLTDVDLYEVIKSSTQDGKFIYHIEARNYTSSTISLILTDGVNKVNIGTAQSKGEFMNTTEPVTINLNNTNVYLVNSANKLISNSVAIKDSNNN